MLSHQKLKVYGKGLAVVASLAKHRQSRNECDSEHRRRLWADWSRRSPQVLGDGGGFGGESSGLPRPVREQSGIGCGAEAPGD